MNKLEEQLWRVIRENETGLGIFINNKINNKVFRNKNIKELVRLLPIIMEHMNKDNIQWVNNLSFTRSRDFLDTFIDNMDKINLENNHFILEQIFSNIFQLQRLSSEQIKRLIDKLLECNIELSDYDVDTLYTIIRRNDDSLLEYMLKKFVLSEKKCDGCVIFILYGYISIYLDIILENIDYVLENIKTVDLFDFKKKMSDNKEIVEKTQKIIIEKIKKRIEENKLDSVKRTINRLYNCILNDDSHVPKTIARKNLDTILEVIYLIIEDICKNENIKVSDMNILGDGAYSIVLELGGKVVKIGYKRGTKTFPNNPYINAILLRKEFSITNDTSFFVEVNEKVNTKSEIPDEELYQLYKKIRELNLIWVDVAERNVGRLLKDNKVHWREVLPLTDERLGLQPFRGNETLKKGDLVVLDNDLIFDENDKENLKRTSLYQNDKRKSFEKRYQEEKRHQINKMEKNEVLEEIHPKKR